MPETKPAPLDIKFAKRFSTNLFSNIVYFILNIIIGLALVPFFLDTLGPSAYGLIPLATSITSYVTLIIDAMNQSVSRYLTLDLQRADVKQANETFNTAIFGTLAIILIVLPLAVGAALYAPVFFNIGDQLYSRVFWLFALVFGSVLIRAWSSNFTVVLFAYNRLELRNYVNIINLGLQVVFVVVFFQIFGPSLPLVGVSYLLAAVASLILAVILSRKVCSYLILKPSLFMRSRFRELAGMSVWLIITLLGIVLRAQIALIIVNKLFGDIAGTNYSLALMWLTLLSGIAGLVTNTFTPMIYSYRTKNDTKGLIHFSVLALRCTSFLMVLPIALVCIFAPQLLTLWVGEEYAFLAPLVWILVVQEIFLIQSACLAPINAAFMRVRVPAFGNIIAGILMVILALTLSSIPSLGMYGVAFATLTATIVLSGGVSTLYNAYVVDAPLMTFVRPMLGSICAFILLSASGLAFTALVSVNSMGMLILSGSVITVLYLGVLLRFVLKKEERNLIRSCLPIFIADKIPPRLL